MLHCSNADRTLWKHVLHRTVLARLGCHQPCHAFRFLFIRHRSPVRCVSLHKVGKTICYKTASNAHPDNLSPFLIIGADYGPSTTPNEVIEKEQALMCTSCDGWHFYLIFVFIGYVLDAIEIPPASVLRVPRIRVRLRTRCQKVMFEVIW